LESSFAVIWPAQVARSHVGLSGDTHHNRFPVARRLREYLAPGETTRIVSDLTKNASVGRFELSMIAQFGTSMTALFASFDVSAKYSCKIGPLARIQTAPAVVIRQRGCQER